MTGTLILILHNSTTEHVDAGNIVQVKHVQDNDEHDVPMLGKKHLCNVFLNELLVIIKTKIN